MKRLILSMLEMSNVFETDVRFVIYSPVDFSIDPYIRYRVRKKKKLYHF